MDIKRGQFPPPPNYEQYQRNIRYIDREYKLLRSLTCALVIAICIIFLLTFTVFALSLNPKFIAKWTA